MQKWYDIDTRIQSQIVGIWNSRPMQKSLQFYSQIMQEANPDKLNIKVKVNEFAVVGVLTLC